MVARNDITGDAIQTKTASQAYRDNYDLIFGKKKTTDIDTQVLDVYNEERLVSKYDKQSSLEVEVLENEEMWSQRVIDEENMIKPDVAPSTSDVGKCGCGRSPTGYCIGWHSLTEEEYQQKLSEQEANQETGE